MREMLEISDELKARLTRRQWATLWGQKSMIQPVFVDAHLGDGQQLVAITPLNTRPNYYLIRVDSKWWMDSWRSREQLPEDEHFAEHIDDICSAIEDEVGRKYETDDDGKDVYMPWPALDDEAGVSWCTAMDLLKGDR